jgi:hypothetical protein
VTGQMSLFSETSSAPDIGILGKSELGLAELPAGPERLVGALLRRGLAEEHLPTAAALCLLLDEGVGE